MNGRTGRIVRGAAARISPLESVAPRARAARFGLSRLSRFGADATMLSHTPGTGLALVAVAFLFAPGMDVISKWLVQTHAPAMVGLMRFAAQALLLVPLVALVGQWGRPRAGHVVGGVLLGGALVTFNAALQVMPVANAIAVFFVEPLVLTLLSALILKERIGWRRLTAVSIGLLGALVVVRPNWAEYGPAAGWPLATAICFACYMLVTRVMSMGGRLLALQLWTSIFAVLFLGVLVGWGGATGAGMLAPSLPRGIDWGLIVLLGVIGIASHQMLAQGLARAEASQVAPMQYLEIVSATVLGWMVFGNLPDPLTWAGTAIIIGSGLYVFHRERRLAEVA
jgi:S-adenosylmethionine uptake transporter